MSSTLNIGSMMRKLTVRADVVDCEDRIYQTSSTEDPGQTSLEKYKQHMIPVLDQGEAGGSTGFALATVANYLLKKRAKRQGELESSRVSPYMLCEMAKPYDQWPGKIYEGSSAHGAIGAWHTHGVCSEEFWPSHMKQPQVGWEQDASLRPLGAYFRIKRLDVLAMQAALREIGILYATAMVHPGWKEVGQDGIIPFQSEVETLGGHAIAIVAYDKDGFWLQNSWGEDWGKQGLGRISYEDWLANGMDVWVVRLCNSRTDNEQVGNEKEVVLACRESIDLSYEDLEPHVISITNNGYLEDDGDYGTSEAKIARIFQKDFPRIKKEKGIRHLLLYAHGGLVSEGQAIGTVKRQLDCMLENGIYPVYFVWRTDFFSTLVNMLENAINKPNLEMATDTVTDFLDGALDRIDDKIESFVREVKGKKVWEQMKRNALLATQNQDGGARIVAKYVADLVKKHPDIRIHIVGHSAGSIFHAPFVQLLTERDASAGYGLDIDSCTLWAPACTVQDFNERYLPAIADNYIRRFALCTLTDEAEQSDHCKHVYNKSLLYLVSNALEEPGRSPGQADGTPIFGMEKFIKEFESFFDGKSKLWIRYPKSNKGLKSHGGFDDNTENLNATIAWITNAVSKAPVSTR